MTELVKGDLAAVLIKFVFDGRCSIYFIGEATLQNWSHATFLQNRALKCFAIHFGKYTEPLQLLFVYFTGQSIVGCEKCVLAQFTLEIGWTYSCVNVGLRPVSRLYARIQVVK
jgi:hypothetical protein